MPAANAAILYHPEGFDTSQPKLMGRQAAGEGFLQAFARHVDADTLFCCAATAAHFTDFQNRLGPWLADRTTAWIPRGAIARLAEPGCLMCPGPGLSEFAWGRRHLDQRAFSLCGITHTTASAAAMDDIGQLLVAPIQSWDALICTSQCVRDTVRQVLGDWGDYLAERIGARPRAGVQLPIIPLGVDCDRFAGTPETAAARVDIRMRNGIAEDDVVVLFVGRLSYHAKANPLPLYLALEAAATRSGKRLHLILAGWFANEHIERAFVDGAQALCPSVNLICLDGRDPNVRHFVWFAADLFASLSDNIQETFGLTPVEAMAAGLPVVATDWNGYRDTVRDGIDGFMIPTRMPPPGFGEHYAFRHFLKTDSYDRYVGYTSQCVAVDVEATAAAITRLATDPALRRQQGAAGRERARQIFDWRGVIAAYQDLWGELALRRRRDAETGSRVGDAPAHPLRADPFRIFASYPTESIRPDRLVVLAPGRSAADFPRLSALDLANLGRSLLAADADCHAILGHLGTHGETPVRALLMLFPAPDRRNILRTVAWLAKLDLIRFAGPSAGDTTP
ncbi:MAG: glycosyltransferase family 4 protein [Rhodospirillales bacterium]